MWIPCSCPQVGLWKLVGAPKLRLLSIIVGSYWLAYHASVSFRRCRFETVVSSNEPAEFLPANAVSGGRAEQGPGERLLVCSAVIYSSRNACTGSIRSTRA